MSLRTVSWLKAIFSKKNQKKCKKLIFFHKKDIILPAKFFAYVNGFEILAANDRQ